VVGLLEATWVNAEFTEVLPEVVEATAWVICATAAANVSDTDRPLVSVAVTLRLSEVDDEDVALEIGGAGFARPVVVSVDLPERLGQGRRDSGVAEMLS